jgi:hypothetical protein
MSCREIRVHGVSAAPPESMLDLRAVPTSRSPRDRVRVHAPPLASWSEAVGHIPVSPDTEAYSWGGLTSGRPSTALWLLLLPFVVANVAGWAMLPDGDARPTLGGGASRSWRATCHIVLVRGAALLLTALVAAFVFVLLVDLGAWEWGVQVRGYPAWTLLVAQGVSAGLLTVLWWCTAVRLRPPKIPWRHDDVQRPNSVRSPWTGYEGDPAGRAWLHKDQRTLWDHPGIIERLRAVHLAAGLATLSGFALLATSASDPWLWAMVVAGVAAPVVALLWVSIDPRRSGEPHGVAWRWRALILSEAAVFTVAARQLAGDVPVGVLAAAQRATPLVEPRRALIAIGVAYVVLTILTCVPGLLLRGRAREHPLRMVLTAPTLLLAAVGITAAMGSGVSLAMVRASSAACEVNVDATDCPLVLGVAPVWLAFVYTVIVALLIVVVGAAFVRALRVTTAADGSRLMQVLRCMVTGPTRVLAWVFAICATAALGFAGVAVAVSADVIATPRLGDVPTVVAVALGVLLVAPVASLGGGRLWSWSGWPNGAVRVVGTIAAVVAAGAGGWWLVASGRQFNFAGGVALPPQSLQELVLLVGLMVPVIAIGTRVITRGWRDVELRRGVGALWDLGLFWPRWFHPFTPPTYSDQAVTWLADRVRHHVDQQRDVILSAHSQGSVLATAAVLLLDEGQRRHVGLVTYGCPWGQLYAELFPAVFDRHALQALVDGLGDARTIRWRNLWRVTDPIGGPIVAEDRLWLRLDGHAAELVAQVDPDEPRWRQDLPSNDDDPRINRPLGHTRYTLERHFAVVRAQVTPQP